MGSSKTEVEATWKARKCQRCGEKADPLYTVRFSDKARTKVVKSKATSESRSHYCAGCTKKRVKEYERTAKANKAKGTAKPVAKRAKAAA